MFGLFKKKAKVEEKRRKPTEVLVAPVQGRAIDSSKVSDPTFADEMLGRGMAIEPTGDQIFSPVDGTVELIFETKHAMSIRSASGAEIMIHIGLDTVKLKGEPFEIAVFSGQEVKKGDLLMSVDFAMIRERGYESTTPIIVCNSDNYREVAVITDIDVMPGDPIMELYKEGR